MAVRLRIIANFLVLTVLVYVYHLYKYKFQETVWVHPTPRNFIRSDSLTLQACSESAKHLYFLKVQKAGSTTVMNLFTRFGMTQDLNVMTLIGRPYSYPLRNFDHLLPRPPLRLHRGKYDIYCEHSVYDEQYLSRKLHVDTINIAIIREPLSHLRSHFYAMSFHRKTYFRHALDPVAKFLENANYFTSRDVTKPYQNSLKHRTKNFFATMFGFYGTGSVDMYLSYLESKFLVLIFECLPESMIVLRRKLCWPMKNVLYLHARKASYIKPAVNKTIVKLHKSWSPLDYVFYDYFTKVMERKIAEQRDAFHQEVDLFKNFTQKSTGFCVDVCDRLGRLIQQQASRELLKPVLFDYEFFQASTWDSAFNVSGVDCIMMALDPAIYRDVQRVHLYPENCHSEHAANTLEVNPDYCNDYFAYGLPWAVLYKPKFVSKCY